MSDREKVFLSIFWRDIFQLQGTTLRRSITYHPQINDQTKVVNPSLETYLRCLINGKPSNGQNGCIGLNFVIALRLTWQLTYLPSKIYTITPHPSSSVFGTNTTSVDRLQQLLVERDAVLDKLRVNLIRAHQQKMKSSANKN